MPSTFAEVVAKGMAAQMRHQPPNKLAVELAATLAFVAREYGATKEIPAETLAECVKLTMQKFGALGLGEIREAYRMAAAGEISPEQKMWGGVFSAAQLGSVLTTYRKYRAKVAAEINKSAHESATAHERAEREARQRADAEPTFWGLVAALKARIGHWCEVPPMYWALAKSLGLAKLSREDAQRIMDAAVAAVPHEKKRRDTADLHAGVKTLREVLRARDENAEVDDSDAALAKEIAGKMAFWELFLGPNA